MPTKLHLYFPSHRCLIALAGLIAAGAGPSAAVAQSIEGQIGLASQYLGKGVGKSNGDVAVSGSVQVGHGDFYANVFASTAELSSGADAEIVTSVGWRPSVAGLGLDLSIVNHDLPGSQPGIDSNYMEYQADASRQFGPVSTRLRVNYTPDGFAATREAWWVEIQGGLALDARTKATVALAERTADGGVEYVAWNAGVKRKLTDALSLDLRWYDTDGHSFGDAYDGRFVAALTFKL